MGYETARDSEGNLWEVNEEHTQARRAASDTEGPGEWFAMTTVRQHFGPLNLLGASDG